MSLGSTKHNICRVFGHRRNHKIHVNLRSFTSTGIAILSRTAIASSSALVYAKIWNNISVRTDKKSKRKNVLLH